MRLLLAHFCASALTLGAASLLAVAPFVSAQGVQVDPRLPPFRPLSVVSGSIKSAGSNAMNNLMTLWAEGFKKHYPSVTVEIQSKGASTAPAALISGTADFALMSRSMKDMEIEDFERAFGHKPTAVPTSIDMLAIYVHGDNPLLGLTLEQVDGIFSKTSKGGAHRDIVIWGDLGLTGEWKDKPIILYGRNSASEMYGYFKEHALANGEFKDTLKEQPDSSSVVQGVASDRYAIGYASIANKTAGVRAVPLAKTADFGFVEAYPENAYSGKYPMSRFLYVYVNLGANGELEPLRREFLRYMFSKEGQQDVVKEGYYPVTAAIAKRALGQVGIVYSAFEIIAMAKVQVPDRSDASFRELFIALNSSRQLSSRLKTYEEYLARSDYSYKPWTTPEALWASLELATSDKHCTVRISSKNAPETVKYALMGEARRGNYREMEDPTTTAPHEVEKGLYEFQSWDQTTNKMTGYLESVDCQGNDPVLVEIPANGAKQ